MSQPHGVTISSNPEAPFRISHALNILLSGPIVAPLQQHTFVNQGCILTGAETAPLRRVDEFTCAPVELSPDDPRALQTPPQRVRNFAVRREAYDCQRSEKTKLRPDVLITSKIAHKRFLH
jgi:hypothetical protein